MGYVSFLEGIWNLIPIFFYKKIILTGLGPTQEQLLVLESIVMGAIQMSFSNSELKHQLWNRVCQGSNISIAQSYAMADMLLISWEDILIVQYVHHTGHRSGHRDAGSRHLVQSFKAMATKDISLKRHALCRRDLGQVHSLDVVLELKNGWLWRRPVGSIGSICPVSFSYGSLKQVW